MFGLYPDILRPAGGIILLFIRVGYIYIYQEVGHGRVLSGIQIGSIVTAALTADTYCMVTDRL